MVWKQFYTIATLHHFFAPIDKRMKSFSTIFVVPFLGACCLLLTSLVLAEEEAQAECKRLHNLEFDANSTFINHGCALECVLNGKVVDLAKLNEGNTCIAANETGKKNHVSNALSMKVYTV